MGGTFIIPPGGSTANTIAPNLAPVLDNTIATPPVSPNDGDSYIIAATATGVWTGLETQIATWNGSAWVYYLPVDGTDITTVTTGTNAGKVYEFVSGVWSEVVIPIAENTPFNLQGTTIDAGANKTSGIWREGGVILGGAGTETLNGHLLRLIQKAIASGAEQILRLEIDDADAQIRIQNFTTQNGKFAPALVGIQPTAEDIGAMLHVAQIGTANDTGTSPVYSINSRRNNAAVETRPLYRVSNYTTVVLQIEANGDVHIANGKLFIETVDSGSTATEVLMHNSATKEVESSVVLTAYISDAPTQALLEDVANWDINGVYTGTAITGTFMGQKHYNGDYFFEAVDNNLWIRLIRG
jgi:hypothetical protein